MLRKSQQTKRQIIESLNRRLDNKKSSLKEQVRAETKICIPMKEIKATLSTMIGQLENLQVYVVKGEEDCVNYEDFKIMFSDQMTMFCNPETNKDWVVSVEQSYDDEMEEWK